MKFKFLKNKEKLQRKQEKSRGRSMVEMLGVLAIIGVLSIGGISGYTIAMRKYRANEIVNFLTKYAFLAYQRFQSKAMNDPGYFRVVDGKPYSDYPNAYKQIVKTYECYNDQYKYYYTRECVPFRYERDSQEYDNFGLGAFPNEIGGITPEFLGVGYNGNTVMTMWIYFKEKNAELCKQINLLLGDGYRSDDADDCDVDKLIVNGIVVDSDNLIGYEGGIPPIDSWHPDNSNNPNNSDNSGNSDNSDTSDSDDYDY